SDASDHHDDPRHHRGIAADGTQTGRGFGSIGAACTSRRRRPRGLDIAHPVPGPRTLRNLLQPPTGVAMKLQTLTLILLLLGQGTINCTRPATIAPAEPPPIVAVVSPHRGDAIRSITLPGDMVGFYESSLYAKVTGYLQSISVDKGDWVKKGQVLATIEVPELQQRVARAEASLEVQRLTYQRLEQVWKSDPRLVARQDVDIAQGKYLEAKADVDELQALVSYTKIVAPFAGIVTGRFVDPGALIKAGGDLPSSGPDEGSAHPVGTASPVVSLAMIDTMRIYVYVPQGVVGFIRHGTPAMVALQDLPGHPFPGTVTRFAA